MKNKQFNYFNVILKPHSTFKQKIKIVLCGSAFLLCIVLGVFIFAPLFNINLIDFSKKTYNSYYYVIYTSPEENTIQSANSLSNNLTLRGAGGNVFLIEQNYYIAISISNNLEKAQNIVKNLEQQKINANILTKNIQINTKKLNKEDSLNLIELYNINLSCINKILELIENLDKHNINNSDANIEIFNLYTTYKTALLNNNQNIILKDYLQKMIKTESLLYLLSQEQKENKQISFVSKIRNYLFKIINVLE